MYIDLSMPVSEKTVVFPGDALPIFEPAGTFSEAGFVDHILHINNHLGTHIDAPGHMAENGKMLEEYEIGRFICDGICIDARKNDHLDAELIANIDVPAGMAVLFYTGCGDRFEERSYATDYPSIDSELAMLLIKKAVSIVGVDMISFDHDSPFPIHKALLENDTLLIENLTNLGQVVGKKFKLYALPVNFKLEAAPARVVAEVQV
jgi:kynurenine formamidase